MASEASLQTDKSMNWVSLRSDLETKPKFNDPVIPAWKPGSSAMDGTLIARKYLLLDSRFRGNDGRVVDENLWFRLCRVRVRKNKNPDKTGAYAKTRPSSVLTQSANMFSVRGEASLVDRSYPSESSMRRVAKRRRANPSCCATSIKVTTD
uniref:Uncharacterized protein n=1 Tax=Candidatus Kentrum sp. LPFa TaxID=2126335 RepID=A0A450WQ74_9GAMM|nr:MAG: hypothetical protein BECKLPF1236B_GA0070989_11644 [Candidatus Kentron sp. LPFa]